MSEAPRAATLLDSPVRRAILQEVASLPLVPSTEEPHARSQGLTASELAGRLDLHVTTIRFHVDQLVEAGLLVGRDVRQGVGRPRRHYAIHPGHLREVERAAAYRLVAEVLAESLAEPGPDGTTRDAQGAAESWLRRRAAALMPDWVARQQATTPGAFLAKMGVLVDLLGQWGYAATVRTTHGGRVCEVAVTDCPVRDLAAANPEVACGVHHGLLRAALDELAEADAELTLRPFVQPDLCIARVTSHADLIFGEEEQ